MEETCTKLLPLQQQFAIRDEITRQRLFEVLPAAMRDSGIDLWLILASECNEDPVFASIVPAVASQASRMTCIIFTLGADGAFGAYSINKPNAQLARFYTQLPYGTDSQWQTINAFIRQQDPRKIGINISTASALGGGLSHALYCELQQNLDQDLLDRLVDADPLSVRWLETRTPRELAMWSAPYEVTTQVMGQAFSRRVITPGVTTTEEVEAWCEQRFADLGLPTCFCPTVNLQRRGESGSMLTGVIRHGDLLHYDAGIQYLGLCTDLQRLAYIRCPGETDAPAGIRQGFERGHRFGALVARQFAAGRSGNEIFTASLDAARAEGLDAMLYTHPIGVHCHGAGPTIGLYDKQAPIEERGDRVVRKNTGYALEFNVASPVAEWGGQKVYFYLEETVVFTEDHKLHYLDDDWHKLILI